MQLRVYGMRGMNRCDVVVVLLECADVTVTYCTSGMSGMWVGSVVCADVASVWCVY